MSSQDDIKKLIKSHLRRLQVLKEKQAYQGTSTPPEIVTEIEDIVSKIEDLRAQLRELELEGNQIIKLLNSGLEKDEVLFKYKQDKYKFAEELMLEDTPKRTIAYCKLELRELDEPSQKDKSDLEEMHYIKGKFHLLLASIYLNEGKPKDLELARDHYDNSKHEFTRVLQLKALAYLGLAITHRKLDDLEEARETCTKAEEILLLLPDNVARDAGALREAVQEERAEIERLLSSNPPLVMVPKAPVRKKFFNIVTGVNTITRRAITDLSFLGYKDYETYEQYAPKKLGFDPDLEKFANKLKIDIEAITYILEVPKGIETSDGLYAGDRILIAEEKNPDRLNNKRVAVLVVEDTEKGTKIHATVKTFLKATQHHYLLQAESKEADSFAISRYGSPTRIKTYYEKYKRGGSIHEKLAHEVYISGEVKGIIRQGDIFAESDANPPPIVRSDPMIWKLPVFSSISAGLGIMTGATTKENIEDYLYLDENERQGANFGVIVEGDSMEDYEISSGDIVLIRQQANIEDGKIAAFVIETSQGSLEVIKEYHYDDHSGRQHWFLKSGNYLSKDLVVIPDNVDVETIENLYKSRVKNIELLKNAELTIAGEYVGKINKEPK